MSALKGKIITVVGSGLIGRSWAMVFLSGGYKVKIYDNKPGQASGAITEIRKQLEELQQAKMLRGNLNVTEQLTLLSSHDDLQQALEGAFFVQECVFEDLEAKQTVFHEVENLVTESVILSSSTSCLMPSNVFSRVQNRTRCIISHPVNPPYYVRLVELVPHPETLPAVMDVAYSLMTDVGQAPVRLKKEIDGFALNRVQYAIIAESWRLVQDGVISVKDIDLVMSEGLGMRYAFIGPIETMHLNAPEGMKDYLQRYSDGMKRVLNTFGPVPDFSGESADRIIKEICELIPSEQEHLTARRERRDQLLMGLAKLKMRLVH
ncbi:lambda-crystallin homolog [Pseudorasbora parva]|uniref:lambda-crystallin homolog n=1 Tax=Pseudorasbora parva TaxID=51549 RepID=UPI00351ED6BD